MRLGNNCVIAVTLFVHFIWIQVVMLYQNMQYFGTVAGKGWTGEQKEEVKKAFYYHLHVLGMFGQICLPS